MGRHLKIEQPQRVAGVAVKQQGGRAHLPLAAVALK